jgi:hypothetical protein
MEARKNYRSPKANKAFSADPRYGLLTSPFGRRYISDEIESETLSDGAAIQHTVEKGISMIRQGPVRHRLQRGSQARICRPTRWALGGPKLDMTATT